MGGDAAVARPVWNPDRGRPRRAVAADLIRKAIATGEFRADLDVEVVLDLLFAPVYYRLVPGHESTAVVTEPGPRRRTS
jgi:hypothetical protein